LKPLLATGQIALASFAKADLAIPNVSQQEQSLDLEIKKDFPSKSELVRSPSLLSHSVSEELRSLNDYNPRYFDLSPVNAKFFVVKSYSEDDIRQSIKHKIWCSTEYGNKRLDTAFRETEGFGPVFLFFSVNGSGHFCGMAQMLNGVDYQASAGVWASPWNQDKWKGQFKVKWIYVKDVPNWQLKHIRLENNNHKPITNSRDTQEVPPEKGVQVLRIIHRYKHSTSYADDACKSLMWSGVSAWRESKKIHYNRAHNSVKNVQGNP